MTDQSNPSADGCVAVHLLDSAQGHPLQTWRFSEKDAITIGRSAENDIAISDPHVSRAHVKLTLVDGAWNLTSMGRHGTLINDQMVAEAKLNHQTVFRLGAVGPMLRFDTDQASNRHGETLDNLSPDMFDMLEVDEKRKQQEVDQIAGNSLFQDLQEQSRRFKSLRNEDRRSS